MARGWRMVTKTYGGGGAHRQARGALFWLLGLRSHCGHAHSLSRAHSPSSARHSKPSRHSLVAANTAAMAPELVATPASSAKTKAATHSTTTAVSRGWARALTNEATAAKAGAGAGVGGEAGAINVCGGACGPRPAARHQLCALPTHGVLESLLGRSAASQSFKPGAGAAARTCVVC